MPTNADAREKMAQHLEELAKTVRATPVITKYSYEARLIQLFASDVVSVTVEVQYKK